MHLRNCLGWGISAFLLVVQPAVSFGAITTATEALSRAGENSPKIKIGGQTVTDEQLSSFSRLLEQFETGYPLEGKALVNEYVLTKLADKIPTTASIADAVEQAISSPLKTVGERTLVKRELRTKLTEEAEVPRSAMEDWYKKNYERYQRPERVHAWHIFMETSEDNATSAPAEVRKRLAQVKAKLDAGTSFSLAAKENSEAASGKTGGEIGYITPKQPIGPLSKPMNPELEAVFFALEPGKVSDVVETRHGMHLLMISEKETTRTPTVDDLVTSGILPGELAQEQVTSGMQALVKDYISKHGGEALPEEGNAEATSATVAYVLDGKNTTIGELSAIFGPRFTQAMDAVKHQRSELKKLMTQAMEDEAMVRAALDSGAANSPETKAILEGLAERAKATHRIRAIEEAEGGVTDAQVAARYKELEEQLRQPEVEGYIVTVDTKESTDTAEEARNRDKALNAAGKIAEQMVSDDYAALAGKLPSLTDEKATATKIARHAQGNTTDPLQLTFDRSIHTVEGNTGVGKPTPIGSSVSVIKLEERHPGNPIPLDQVADRIKGMLESERKSTLQGDLVKRLKDAGLVEIEEAAVEAQSADADHSTTHSH